MKNVSMLFLAAFCCVILLSGMAGCSESEKVSETAMEKESSEKIVDKPSGFGEDFSFSGTWITEFEGETVTLVLNEDAPGTLKFDSLEEPFKFTWNIESSGSDTRQNVRLHLGGAPLILNFRYEGPDTLRIPGSLVLEDGKLAQTDGWSTWERQ